MGRRMQYGDPRQISPAIEPEVFHAVIAAALAAYLGREPEPTASDASPWACKATLHGREESGSWPVGQVTWSQADRPR